MDDAPKKSRRKKPEPAPPEPVSVPVPSDLLASKYGPMVFTTGEWFIVVPDPDPGSNVKRCSIKATFEKDPDGYRGHGNTEAEAEEMLRKYASA